MSNVKKRSNVWAFIIYPKDSAPDNYLNIIESWCIPALVSPLHDKDKNADGEDKKEHVHVMLYFGKGANKSIEQVQEYSKQLNGTIPIIVNNTNAMIRYFVHFDNPEKKGKYKYDKKDLICLSGFEINDAFSSYTNDSLYFDFIEDWIKENNLDNFFNLVFSLKINNFVYELDFLRRHTMYFKAMLDARYHLNNPQKKKKG